MISIRAQESLLIGISRKLPRRITVYAIGGTAMMFLGHKDSTVDIDMVFTKEKDRKDFITAAISMGYECMDSGRVYGTKDNQPIMLRRADERFDLFLNEVISFTFSADMEKRAVKTHEFGETLVLKIADPHDIILMKCATDRVKDYEDIRNIIQSTKINWDIIIGEAENQVNLGRTKSVFSMIGTLLALRKAGVEIPERVFKNIWKLIGKNKKVCLLEIRTPTPKKIIRKQKVALTRTVRSARLRPLLLSCRCLPSAPLSWPQQVRL